MKAQNCLNLLKHPASYLGVVRASVLLGFPAQAQSHPSPQILKRQLCHQAHAGQTPQY